MTAAVDNVDDHTITVWHETALPGWDRN